MKPNLSTPENEIFDRAFKIFSHLSEREEHFNKLETNYRLLASTWLLASLGAIGFILIKADKESLPFDAWIIVSSICIVSSIGIFLLWILDLRVYHQLLVSVFVEGVILEHQFRWLPQIRNNMISSMDGGDVTKRVVLYYSFTISLLLAICGLSLTMISQNTSGLSLPLIITVFLVIIVGVNLFMIWRSNIHTKHIAYKLSQELDNIEKESPTDNIKERL